MSKQFHIHSAGKEVVPSTQAIRDLATGEQYVLVTFPSTTPCAARDLRETVERLASELEENFVIGSDEKQGQYRITVTRTVPFDVVVANEPGIVAAAVRFSAEARQRMTQLATTLGAHIEAFSDPLYGRKHFSQTGLLDDEWRYFFHGYECQFFSMTTGQTLEVILGFEGQFGVLDPHFFYNYLRTTPGMQDIAALFPGGHADVERALDILGERGVFQRASSEAMRRTGWAWIGVSRSSSINE